MLSWRPGAPVVNLKATSKTREIICKVLKSDLRT
jgi:hypothetical protein